MELIHDRCAGLDVHKEVVVAAICIAVNKQVQQEVRSFNTTTAGLLALAEWLASFGCTHVAMEATGVYWKPVWHILENSVLAERGDEVVHRLGHHIQMELDV